MNIGEILKSNDTYTYRQLEKMKQEPKKTKKGKGKVKLGDSVTNLMKANSYERKGRRIKQTRWS